jgi:hypothetical protein
MSMKTPFHLQRRPHAEPATALLLLSHKPEDLLQLCACLGLDPLPPTYSVTDGFLVRLPQPTTQSFVGALKLRNLANNLLLPTDGDLVPALLEDEAAALVSRRGLIFLPGGRVLEFRPEEPLPLTALVTVERVERGIWRPLPDAPDLPDRINEITLDQPPERADDILEEGGKGIGSEDPRPANSSILSKMLGKAALQFGKGVAGLGHALNLSALARLGANWMARGLSVAPRLSESLLGKQEAALRALLQKFRDGDIDWALRHAVPLTEERLRGAQPASGASLPTHDLLYSLRNILGGSSGPAGVWFSKWDAYQELQREYRKLAEKATREGDYRRAAFIYGKLLRDFRAAAAVLSQGGLHRDAATLYLSKVGDSLAAAREYEAAGAFDDALRLYRQGGKHEQAAELLRRIGEEELAVAEYQLAAAELAARGHGDYQAGELLLNRAKRPDLALPYYQSGWQRRLSTNSVPCGIRLAQLYVEEEAKEKLLRLVSEAELFLLPTGNYGPAADFFNELNLLADCPNAASLREELQDRALLGLATKTRQQAVEGAWPADIVNRMFNGLSRWPPAVISDAQFAVQAAVKRQRTASPSSAQLTTTIIQGCIPVVTAVTWAAGTGHLFLGYESGEVFCFRPLSGEVVPLPTVDLPVKSLATDAEGDRVVVLRSQCNVISYARLGNGFQQVERANFGLGLESWLCDQLIGTEKHLVGFWSGHALHFLDYFRLTVEASLEPSESPPNFHAAILLLPLSRLRDLTLLGFEGDTLAVCMGYPNLKVRQFKILGWCPSLPRDDNLSAPLIASRRTSPEELELAGIGEDGVVHRSVLTFHKGDLLQIATQSASDAEPFRAVTFTRPGTLAAVAPTGVHWFQAGTKGLRAKSVTNASLPTALACFPHFGRHELIVVCSEGNLVRVPFPF